ncbi:hypothetical protein SAMN02799620_01793 [Mycolicibacterium fluoranthenivorans]|uniref:Uncharacterized protein n=2 Tax=Mycobacteriaceae TaxID=1762 RepID=A0A1G4VVQ6_9MYCO|nr:hypothetical protein SAMN02799620_01793 [Mycolicibacterium fluoranthenivorans]
MEVTRVAMNPWDFTLYRSTNGDLILKVIFSEGEYKTDIGRYFLINSLKVDVNNIEQLKSLAARIREDYPAVPHQEIAKSDVIIVK